MLNGPGLGDHVVTAVFLSFQPALEDQTHRVITGARALVCTHPRDSAYATPVSTGLPASSAGLGDLGLTVSVCGLLPLLVCLPLCFLSSSLPPT